MTPELSPDLRQAVHQLPGNEPLRVVDPDTNTVYFLVRAEVFEQVQSVLQNNDDIITDTYAAQSEAALKGGWGEKKMADYDHYEEHRNEV